MDVTLKQFAEVTQRHIETARRLARSGRINGAYKVGRCWLIRADALDTLRGVEGKEVSK